MINEINERKYEEALQRSVRFINYNEDEFDEGFDIKYEIPQAEEMKGDDSFIDSN